MPVTPAGNPRPKMRGLGDDNYWRKTGKDGETKAH